MRTTEENNIEEIEENFEPTAECVSDCFDLDRHSVLCQHFDKEYIFEFFED